MRKLGVESGDTLFVHSSFKRLGPVEGGAAAVVEALECCIGAEGMILMPSFNLVEGGHAARAANWCVETTRSTVGWITEYFRTMVGTHRSDHYSHSVAARGKGAEEYVSRHKEKRGMVSPWDFEPWGRTWGCGSPMVRAYADPQGKVLMLGVDYRTATYCHMVEVMHWNAVLQDDPEARMRGYDRERLGAYWDALGRVRRGLVGNAPSRLFQIKDFVDILLALVEKNPTAWSR